jgi:hypothetical protein
VSRNSILPERPGSALPSAHSGSRSSRIAAATQSSQRPGLPRARVRRMSELLTRPARSFLVDSQFTRRDIKIKHAFGDDNICRVVRDRKVRSRPNEIRRFKPPNLQHFLVRSRRGDRRLCRLKNSLTSKNSLSSSRMFLSLNNSNGVCASSSPTISPNAVESSSLIGASRGRRSNRNPLQLRKLRARDTDLFGQFFIGRFTT